MPSGKVKWFNSKKGYGFITLDDDSQKDVFLHVSALEKSKFRILKENQKMLHYCQNIHALESEQRAYLKALLQK